jgi:hypothetical protein
MNLAVGEIIKAVGYVIMSGVLYIAWKLAYDEVQNSGIKNTLTKGLSACIFIAFIFSNMLGEPSCIDREEDGRGGTCVEYADDGFKPTQEQRVATFAYYLTLLGVPVLYGVYTGSKQI